MPQQPGLDGSLSQSTILAVISIGVQIIGLSCASSTAIAVANRVHGPRGVASVASAASVLAFLLALLALAFAVISWSEQPRWRRLFVLCLSIGALLWSLIIV